MNTDGEQDGLRERFTGAEDVLAVILGGGRGTRLYPLTQVRCKPAVPFGGKYRLIDIPISNCINSAITKIFVLTQFNSASLMRHVTKTYQFGAFQRGFVDILAAQQTMERSDWYQGTADAVRQNLRAIGSRTGTYILILGGDHLYRMDYRDFLTTHVQRGADISIAVYPVRREEASSYGILRVDAEDRIIEFHEKPRDEALLDRLAFGRPGGEKRYLASMGIYVFSRHVLPEALSDNAQTDFGKEIIPSSIKKYRVVAHHFDGYWRDIGTTRSYYEANLEMVSPLPPFNFYDTRHPIYTRARFLPACKINSSVMERCLVADGSIITHAEVRNSVVGLRSVIRPGSRILDSVIIGADYYEGEVDAWGKPSDPSKLPPIGIGENVHIERCIIDKNARIGNNVTIINRERHEKFDGPNYVVREGLVLIPKDSIIESGTII
jgi:glucose-1-phosphate adenylyltransferase